MVYWGEHFLAVYGCWGGGSLLPHSAERQSSASRGRYSRLRYRLFRSESDEPVKVERYCNGHPCMGVGASSWLEWSSGGDGGPSVPDQALLDAQVPGGSAPALNDQGCQCVVSWRLGVSNVMTSRDAGWMGLSNERGAVCPAGRGYFGCLQSPWWRLVLSGRNARGWGATGGGLGVLRVCGGFV